MRHELLSRQQRQATASIAHLWSTDCVYHLGTLRRHRPADGSCPFFTLHAEHTEQLLLRADRDREGRGFLVSCPAGAPAGEAGRAPKGRFAGEGCALQYACHLRADASLSAFSLYDNGLPRTCPRGTHQREPELERKELAHVTLRHSLWTARSITVALPAGGAARAADSTGSDTAPPAAPPARPGASLASRARRQRWALGADPSVVLLHNAAPSWSAELRAFTLPFYGRVHLASKKNFQLIDRRRPDVTVMSFGKGRRDVYALDWCAPLSCAQALGIALSSFDSCLAGGK